MSLATGARIGSASVQPLRPLTRRQVLLGAAGGLLVAACGGGSDDEGAATTASDAPTETTGTTTPGAAGAAGGLVAFKLFPPAQPFGVPVRLPLALADAEGSFDVDLPDALEMRLRRPDGTTLPPVTVERHDEGLPRGYFPLRTTLDAAGRWSIVLETGTTQVETTVDAKPPAELPAIPGPGDRLPAIPTPTRADPQGVDPICTNDPVCPFHAQSLDQVLGAGNPIVLIVSTPAFCQIAICGPVLDILIEREARLREAGLAVIHAEVYVDDRARETTPTVDALGLTFEPAIFFAAPDGTVTDRLDAIFDGREVDAALDRLIP